MNRSIVALAAAMLLSAGPALASDTRAMSVIAAARAATGGVHLDRPQMFHERGIMTRGDQTGAYETWGDLLALRSHGTQTFGDRTRGGGFDGAVSWQATPDGKVRTAADAGTLRSERLGTWLTLSGYLYPARFPAEFHYVGRKERDGRGYQVVSATPKDADTVELWFDDRSHRLAHIESNTGGETLVGDVSDYRLIDGTWVGFRLAMIQSGHPMTLQLTSFVYEPRDEARLVMPKAD